MKVNRNKIQIILFALLVFGLIITISTANKKTFFNIRADINNEPKNLKITNITSNSFTITYNTGRKVFGTIKYGSDIDNINKIALDDRDQLTQRVNSYNSHSITIRELNPDSYYYFLITSGDKIYPSNDKLFKLKTGSIINNTPLKQLPLSGTLIDSNNNPLGGALIIFSVNGSQTLSDLTRSNGTFTIPLNSLRNINLNNYYSINPTDKIKILSVWNNSSAEKIINIDAINSAQTLQLKNNLDLSKEDEIETENYILNNEITVTPQNNQKIEELNEKPSDIITFINNISNLLNN